MEERTNRRPMRLFRAPAGLDFQAVILRELEGEEELAAAVNADIHTPDARKTENAASLAILHERIMLSIVELTDLDGKRRRFTPAEPCDENFGARTRRFLERRFFKVNSLDQEDLDFELGGELVDERSSTPLAEAPSIAQLTRR